MPPFYEGSALDVAEEALKLIRTIEREAPDEDMVVGMCMQASQALQYRVDVSMARLREAQTARTIDNRKALIRAKVKGVKEAPWPPPAPDAPRVQLAGVIPDALRER